MEGAPGDQLKEGRMRFETAAIHTGQDPDALYGSVNVPIYQTSTYAQPAVGEPKVFDYARGGNPTREAFQTALAALEGGERAFAFGSGMAAETTLLLSLRPGDHVVLPDDVYGGTYRLLSTVLEPWGLSYSVVDLTDLEDLRDAIREETRVVWLETPSNPMLRIVDVAAVTEIAHEAGTRVVVDNTFATPALQRPLELGADAVVHSVTKYIGGHSDLIGGAVVTSDPEWIERLGFLANAVGAVPGPMDCYLGLRGLKTLALRMAKHSENAAAIAAWLSGDPRVGGSTTRGSGHIRVTTSRAGRCRRSGGSCPSTPRPPRRRSRSRSGPSSSSSPSRSAAWSR